MTEMEINDFTQDLTIAAVDSFLKQSAGGTTRRVWPSAFEYYLFSGAIRVITVLTPPQITADQDDYQPTGYAATAVMRLSSDADRNITGLVPPAAAQYLMFLMNVGSYSITLKHEDASSSASNRFDFADGDFELKPKGMCLLIYDSTASRWRLIGGGGGAGAPSVYQIASPTTLGQEALQYIGAMSTTLAGGTITLPASPEEGDRVYFKDEQDDAGTNNVTIAGNGNDIDGASSFVMNVDGQALMLIYANSEWRIF